MQETTPQTPVAGPVTVSFLGGALVLGLPKAMTLELERPITAEELFCRLAEKLAMPDLRVRLTSYLVILVDGTSIQHQEGWQTIVRPGSVVSVVAPMGGG